MLKSSLFSYLRQGLKIALFLGMGMSLMPSAHAFKGEAAVIDQCQKGDLNQCQIAVQNYISEKKFPQAVTILNRMCGSNHAEAAKACALEMTLLIDPEYGLNNVQEGVRLGDMLCVQKQPYGCLLLSNLYFSGHQVKQDLQLASDYAKRACELKDAVGCRQAALISFTTAYVLKDVDLAKEAYTYYRRACDLGNKESCLESEQAQQKLEDFRLYATTPSEQAPMNAPAPQQ